MTPRSRTVDDEKSGEEEVESESLVHCRRARIWGGLSLRRIDRLYSMMLSMQARSLFVAFATSLNHKSTYSCVSSA